jgi:hypothetical protein
LISRDLHAGRGAHLARKARRNDLSRSIGAERTDRQLPANANSREYSGSASRPTQRQSSNPANEAAVIRHFQERMQLAVFVTTFRRLSLCHIPCDRHHATGRIHLSGPCTTRTELIIQLLKIAIGLAFGAYFVWWSLEVLDRLAPENEAPTPAVGHIVKVHATPVGSPSMWTLAFGCHEDRTPTHGYAATLACSALRRSKARVSITS